MEYAIMRAGYDMRYGPMVVPVSRNTGKEKPEENHPYPAHEVLTRFFGESFDLVIGNFIKMEPEAMRKTSLPDESTNYRLLKTRYLRTQSLLFQPTDRTVVDFLVAGDVQADLNGEQITRAVTFRVRYVLDLRCCVCICCGPLIFIADNWRNEPVFGEEYYNVYAKTAKYLEIPLNDYLLPIIYSDQYELVAKQMIDFYYPEARNRIGYFAVDAEELATRMGQKVIDVHFKDPTIWGQIYHEFGEVELLDDNGRPYTMEVKPCTILISIDRCTTKALRSSTILHECCHMFLDRWFFLLQAMAGKAYRSYTSRRREKKVIDKGPLDWMEFQCEKLPAYIMLESESTVEFVNEILHRSRQLSRVAAYHRAVKAVSEKYGTSMAMARVRMIGLGFAGAEGICNYVDGHSVPDHGCENWPDGVTYTIPVENAIELLQQNKAFAEKVRRGEYVFVENHFCRNRKDYFIQFKGGGLGLSDYARNHIDECCVAFNVSGNRTNGTYRDSYASRGKRKEVKNHYLSTYTLSERQDEHMYVRENNDYAYDVFLWGELGRDLPKELKAAVDFIIKKKGLTQEKVALEMGVDRKVLYNILNATRPSMEHVVGLCIALKIPFYISLNLIQNSGNHFIVYNKAHQMYQHFLCMPGDLTVERCNDILRQAELPPLFQNDAEKV